ncbi:MAG TPA: GNAT family N-acetyltransferase, partial [Candidatus Izemoplasmatales bacterium]|nr:GNAT family N-acetyltransferase [Candidatus Izemoplasmatales bacterium]
WLGDYPNAAHFKADLKSHGLYVYLDKGQIIGSISILQENDPPYQAIQWHRQLSLVIHRFMVDPNHQKKGVGIALFEHAIQLTTIKHQSLKVDTHPDNVKMQKLILKMNFEYMGYLSSINRLAYELIV